MEKKRRRYFVQNMHWIMVQRRVFIAYNDFGFDSSGNWIVGHTVALYIYIIKNKQRTHKKNCNLSTTISILKIYILTTKNDLKCQIITHVYNSSHKILQIFNSIAVFSRNLCRVFVILRLKQQKIKKKKKNEIKFFICISQSNKNFLNSMIINYALYIIHYPIKCDAIVL